MGDLDKLGADRELIIHVIAQHPFTIKFIEKFIFLEKSSELIPSLHQMVILTKYLNHKANLMKKIL
jgi:hypothetical protein